MKINNKGFTNDLFRTPHSIFKQLDDIFNFTLDAACTSYDSKCMQGNFYDKGIDGLSVSWQGRVFCNPPV